MKPLSAVKCKRAIHHTLLALCCIAAGRGECNSGDGSRPIGAPPSAMAALEPTDSGRRRGSVGGVNAMYKQVEDHRRNYYKSYYTGPNVYMLLNGSRWWTSGTSAINYAGVAQAELLPFKLPYAGSIPATGFDFNTQPETITWHRNRSELKLKWEPSETGDEPYGYGLFAQYIGEASYREQDATGIGTYVASVRLPYGQAVRFYVAPLWRGIAAYYPSMSEASDFYIWDSNPLSIRRDGTDIILTWPREWATETVHVEASEDMVNWTVIMDVYSGAEVRLVGEAKKHKQRFYRLKNERN